MISSFVCSFVFVVVVVVVVYNISNLMVSFCIVVYVFYMVFYDGIVIFFVDVSFWFYRGDINVSSLLGGFSVMLCFYCGLVL